MSRFSALHSLSTDILAIIKHTAQAHTAASPSPVSSSSGRPGKRGEFSDHHKSAKTRKLCSIATSSTAPSCLKANVGLQLSLRASKTPLPSTSSQKDQVLVSSFYMRYRRYLIMIVLVLTQSCTALSAIMFCRPSCCFRPALSPASVHWYLSRLEMQLTLRRRDSLPVPRKHDPA